MCKRSLQDRMYKYVLICSIGLILIGMVLTAFSLFSPLWQVAEQSKLGEIHQHGLWWDCVISDGTLIPLAQSNAREKDHLSCNLCFPRHGYSAYIVCYVAYGYRPRVENHWSGDSPQKGHLPGDTDEQCLSKFDPVVQSRLRSALEATDALSREVLLHRFLPHHKAVIFFSVFTFVFGFIGMVTGACSPCFPPNSLLYVVSIFMTSACSILSDIIFIFGATQSRKVKVEPVSVEEAQVENRLGLACYVHMIATAFFLVGLIFSVAAAYLLISSNKGREGCCISKKDYMSQQRWQRERRSVLACNRTSCRPIVVIEDDSL